MATRPIESKIQNLPEVPTLLFDGVAFDWLPAPLHVEEMQTWPVEFSGVGKSEGNSSPPANSKGGSNVVALDPYRARFQSKLTGWSAMLEKLILELGRMQDGWDGPDTVAPSIAAQRDFEATLTAFPKNANEPELEVDGSTGAISVRWWSAQRDRSLVLNFVGDGNCMLMCFDINGTPVPPQIFPASDETRLLDMLDEQHAMALISSAA